MLDLDLTTVVFQLLNFLVLAALLYYFLFRRVMQRIEERAAEKEQLAREAEQNRQEAARLRTEQEERLERVEEKVAEIVAQARERMEDERKELLEELREEAERILGAALSESRRLQQQEMEAFHDDLLDAIMDIATEVIHQVAPQEVHDLLVQQLNDRIWEMGRKEMREVEMLRRSLGERSPTVHAVSARSLSEDQKQQLAQTFSAVADRNVNLELEMDPSLAAGIHVRVGDMVVENSIAKQLDQLREDVSKALKARMTDA
jgi:F-type H+-transporting ATPase subunit b